jgi:hypothetical protein
VIFDASGKRSSLYGWLLIAALCITAWFAYVPGLSGSFLFDDFANLPAIGGTGPVDNAATFWRYITSGLADPTGRPVALLSFLIDARNWPADPLPFKRTNLLLHLLNGILLWRLLRALGKATIGADQHQERPLALHIELAAVLGTALWLLHPLLVSTTLYIVQREAMLPATFALAGLLTWLKGRQLLGAGRRNAGLLWIACGLGFGTLLGLLSKANGILLPIYVLALEFTVMRAYAPLPAAQAPAYRRSMAVLAGIPALIVLLYLAWRGYKGIVHGVGSHRPWTLGERLLTEPSIVLDYLRLLWLPRPFTAGLFNDQIEAVHSLWSLQAWLPIALLVTLIAFAFCIRKRLPIASAALLFFFAGHLLESTTIALELYFEHRNYVPSMLLFWPLAWWLCGLDLRSPAGSAKTERLSKPSVAMRLALTATILGGLTVMTHARADLWGNAQDQALLWAQLNPDSPRAQANAAQVEVSAGLPEQAAIRLQRAIADHPDEIQLVLNLLATRCAMGGVDVPSLTAAAAALRTARVGSVLLTNWFERAIDQATSGNACPGLGLNEIGSLLDAADENPYNTKRHGSLQDIWYLRSLIALRRHDPEMALTDLNKAIDLQVRAGAALHYAALLGSKGFPSEGLAHLAHYDAIKTRERKPASGMPRIHAWILQRQDYWAHEFTHLRGVLEDDLRMAKTTEASP